MYNKSGRRKPVSREFTCMRCRWIGDTIGDHEQPEAAAAKSHRHATQTHKHMHSQAGRRRSLRDRKLTSAVVDRRRPIYVPRRRRVFDRPPPGPLARREECGAGRRRRRVSCPRLSSVRRAADLTDPRSCKVRERAQIDIRRKR